MTRRPSDFTPPFRMDIYATVIGVLKPRHRYRNVYGTVKNVVWVQLLARMISLILVTGYIRCQADGSCLLK